MSKEQLKKKAFVRFGLWVASTGQEPYSILMTLLENGINLDEISLRASDISDQALAKARSGTYNMIEIQRGLPAVMMVKYFNQIKREWQIKDDLRKKFHSINLTSLKTLTH